MRISFHHGLYPPAPAMEIRLINPLSGRKSSFYHAILDSGADVTIIPTRLLNPLRLIPFRRERVSGMWGGQAIAKIYIVDIEIAKRTFHNVEVLGNPDEKHIWIGRNISNELRLLLDGPDLSVEVLPD